MGSKKSLVTIGIILVVIGIIGLLYGYATTWMWVLLVLGVVGLLWGWMGKGKQQ